MLKINKGITMVSLIMVIILLLILAGVSYGTGTKVIKQSELENTKTDMLLIKAKAKEYLENASFKLGTSFDTITDENEKNNRITSAKAELKGTEITANNISKFTNIISEEDLNQENIYYYYLTTDELKEMGINDVKSDEKSGIYVIKYDLKNSDVIIYNTKGFTNENKTYYSINEIEDLNL